MSNEYFKYSEAEQQLMAYAFSCVNPGIQYLTDTLSSTLKDALEIFKAARLFSPHKVQKMQPSASSIDCLSVFPFLKSSLPRLKNDLPDYLAKAEDISPSYCPLEWWKAHATSLPCWASAVRQVLLIQPTSASSKRAFSMLKNSFGDRQDHSLVDYIEATLMLQYNSII